MVAHFKVTPGRVPAHRVNRDNVEELLGRRAPWFRPGKHRSEDRHYAVCPYCDNAIQLKGVYKEAVERARRYGSHLGEPVDGFVFNRLDLEFCPYKIKASARSKSNRRAPGPVSQELIDLAITEFDRIVLILRTDFGFSFSDRFAGRMLDQWLDSEGYLYTGAHLRNLPWMIAYFGPAQSLYGQYVGNNAELAQGIRTKVPAAMLTEEGQLTSDKKKQFFKLELQCLHHRVAVDPEDGSLIETLKLRVQDFTRFNEPAKAPKVYETQIVFDPDRFEALIHVPPERAWRNETLLALAHDIAAKRGIQCPIPE
ncbi:hypothetical protein RA263_26220 [Pseudomonas syringae pv. tagetis]|uniref:Restriction endonuclease n=3 Tax=Pseudomonas TaxID=286 RepID=A0ABW7NUQ3_9PSED|nr:MULTISPECIES: hypothetical protein [Pseudomonas syringae group]KWS10977.1 hypothetical protein AL064_12265 [Pseudomonas syringae pv. syringae]UNB71464.1 hypothetical protein MME58_27360 [Pseudomonas syringae pv. tagetis]